MIIFFAILKIKDERIEMCQKWHQDEDVQNLKDIFQDKENWKNQLLKEQNTFGEKTVMIPKQEAMGNIFQNHFIEV